MEELNGKLQEPVYDELTENIVARLAERRRKMERMREMEQPSHEIRFVGRAVALAAAACAAALVVFAPWHRVSPLDELGITPDMTEYRGTSPEITEIQNLLEKSDYAAALACTEEALRRSESELKELMSAGMEPEDEGLEYEVQLAGAMNSELRWTYIYLLVRAGRNEDAVRELNIYIMDGEYCGHPAEAELLLEKLGRKK